MNFIKLIFIKIAKTIHFISDFYNSLSLPENVILAIKIWQWGCVAAVFTYILTFVIAIFLEFIGVIRRPIREKQLLMSDALLEITPHSAPLFKNSRSFFNLIPLMILSWITVIYIFTLMITQRYTTTAFLKKDVKIWKRFNTIINTFIVFLIFLLVVLMIII